MAATSPLKQMEKCKRFGVVMERFIPVNQVGSLKKSSDAANSRRSWLRPMDTSSHGSIGVGATFLC